MKPALFCLRFASCFSLIATTLGFPPAQTFAAEIETSSAYVYVSHVPHASGPNQVSGFAVAPSGKLTPTPGSPYPADVYAMVDNGKFLFGTTTDNRYIDTYTIEPGGALKLAVSNNLSQLTGGLDNLSFNAYLDLDHTGSTLYASQNLGQNYYLEAFAIDKHTGALRFLPQSELNENNNLIGPGDFTISANDKYVYQVNSGYDGAYLSMFDRDSDGALLYPPPAVGVIDKPANVTGYEFDPLGISADPTNHVAVAFANFELPEGPEAGPNRLAVYTAAEDGHLTTTSTRANMADVAVGDVSLKMAPSGKLLAAFGTAGLQVFHFNGGAPITNQAVLVSGVDFEQAFWDDNNHLFAVSEGAGRLYVFTVTPQGHAEAPGSPYSIPGAEGIILRIIKP